MVFRTERLENAGRPVRVKVFIRSEGSILFSLRMFSRRDLHCVAECNCAHGAAASELKH